MEAFTHSYLALGGVSTVLALTAYVLLTRLASPHLPLPPGPKGQPIVGMVFGMPQGKAWLGYDEWFKQYGDMIYFKIFGQGILVLGSLTRTNDLLEKRSANYSDRPNMPMLVDLMGWGFNLGLMPYGPRWRRHRRVFHDHFNPGVISKYHPTLHRETRALLRRLLETPEDFMRHIRHSFGATIMDVVYGIRVSGTDDPFLSNIEEALRGIAAASTPGRFLVDQLPILKYVPSWMPGANFKRFAAHLKALNVEVLNKPYQHVKETLRQGAAPPSMVATLIENISDDDEERRMEDEDAAKSVPASAYAGGADTTLASTQFFFLAMAMYPEVQRKAQAEIDAVVGPHRLPGYNDRDSLPYVNAMMKELLRWHPVGPLGIPHLCSSDDEYDGYLIPKGTLVFGSVWGILHNPETYPNPEKYDPERWLKDGKLNPDVQDSAGAAFGFGRRICPGLHMSDASLYSVISAILAVYTVTAPLDEHGHPISFDEEVTADVISYPAPFGCVIKPRSGAAEALIRELDIE